MAEKKDNAQSIAFLNAKIRPYADQRIAQAMLICDGFVAAVGTKEEILGQCGEKTAKVDLRGQSVLPGFFDSHIHLIETSKILQETWLGDVRSVEELIERGQRDIGIQREVAGGWIFGRGWNQENLDGKKYPTRHDLDRICSDRPILYQRCCGIVGVLNTKGLEMMGIDENFAIPGGLVDKDENGFPTGVVRREALDGWVKRRLPKMDKERARELLREITRLCAKTGMTSAQSDDLVMYRDPDLLEELYLETEESGELALRVGQQYLLRNPEAVEAFIRKGHKTGEHLKKGDAGVRFSTGPLKVIVDGSLGSRTAALRKDYADAPGERGLFVHADDELAQMMKLAHENDLQMAIHAIGDAATEKVLDIVEKLQASSQSRWKHRIVHCQIGDKGLYERMARLQVGADVQAPFVASEWSWVPDRVGPARASESYAWKTLLDLGVVLGGSSDSPVENYAPLWGVQTAVTRMDGEGNPPGGWLPDQRLSLERALGLYTMGSASVCGQREEKGTLEPGKYGDFVVLAEDPFLVEPTNLSAIPVSLTIQGGEPTYVGDAGINI